MEASGADDRAVHEAWTAYRDRVNEYDPYEQQLLASYDLLLDQPVSPEDDALEELVAASEEVENRLLVAQWHVELRSNAAERLEDAAVALAALDLHLAASIYRLVVSREAWDQFVAESKLAGEVVESLLAHATEELAEGDVTRLAELVRDADATLSSNAVMGAQDIVLPLQALTDETISDLAGKAREPTLAFVRLLPALILPEAVRRVLDVSGGDPFQLLPPFQRTLSRPLVVAMRLVTTGMRKLASAIGLGPDTILGAVTALLGDQLAQRLDELKDQNADRAIGKIVRRGLCEEQVHEIMKSAKPEFVENPPGGLYAAYVALQTGFGEKQQRVRKVAGALRLLAPFIVVIHPPVGPAALLAIILVGAGYTLVGLADRLDTSSFVLINKIDGVPTLLKAHVT